MRKVAVIMGSTSDLPVAEKAIQTLKEYGIETEVRVLSAHRCPNEAREFAASARESGFSCIIPVATVAIDGAKNAAILAVQIMAVSDEGLAHKLQAARDEGTAAVLKADEELRERYKN